MFHQVANNIVISGIWYCIRATHKYRIIQEIQIAHPARYKRTVDSTYRQENKDR